MLKKGQVLTMVSIAIISFLVGTMFNEKLIAMSSDGTDDYGVPFDKIWKAISELQTKAFSLNASLNELQGQVDTIEKKTNQAKTIRFYEPNETENNQQTYKDGAIFVWTPNNSTDNAILQIHIYFQYRSPGQGLGFRIVVNDETNPHGIGPLIRTTYTWSSIYIFIDTIPGAAGFNGIPIVPNQNNYTIKFQFKPQGHLDTAYVKDVNIIIEVVDGLPAND